MAVANLTLAIQLQGAAQTQAGLRGIQQTATGVTGALGLMRAALVAIATFEIAKRFLELADTFTQLQNRLRILTGNVKDFTLISQALVLISEQTGTSLEANGLLFTRLARAVAGTGATYVDVLKVTKELGEAVLISGANSIQAKQGFLQFAEGMGSGVLRGRQLRSVVQDFPALAELIAKGFNVAGGGAALLGFALANPNILTAPKVLKALLDGSAQLDAEFKTTTFTIGQGFENITTALTVFLGTVLKTTAAGRIISDVLQGVADNIGKIVTALLALAAIFVINTIVSQVLALGTTIATLVTIMAELASTAGVVVGALALIVVPLVAIAFALRGNNDDFDTWAAKVIITIQTIFQTMDQLPTHLHNMVVGVENHFGQQIARGANGIANLPGLFLKFANPTRFKDLQYQDFFGEDTEIPKTPTPGFDALYAQNLAAAQKDSPRGLREEGVGAGGGKVTFANAAKNAVGGVFDALKGIKGLSLGDIFQQLGLDKLAGTPGDEANKAVKGLQAALNLVGQVEPLLKFDTEMAKLKADIEKVSPELKRLGIDGEDAFNRMAEAAAGFGPRVAEINEKAQIAIQQFQASQEPGYKGSPISSAALSANISALGGAGSAQGVVDLSKRIEFLNDQMKTGALDAATYAADIREITGTQTDADKFAQEVDKMTISLKAGGVNAAEMNVQLRAAFGVTTPLDAYNASLAKTNALLAAGVITATDAATKNRDATIAYLDTQTDFQSGIDRTFLKMQKDSEDVATQISNVLTDAFSSATDALVSFVNTGKVDFRSLINSIEGDLLKLAANKLFASLSGGNNASGTNNLISTAAGGILSFLGLGGGSSAVSGIVGGGLVGGGAGGFANGGSFDVADGYVRALPSGIDNRLVQFRANDSEQVTVSKRGANVGGSKVELHLHGIQDHRGFEASKEQIYGRLALEVGRANRRQN